MTCKGTCVRYKAKKPVGIGRYASGQKRCQICGIYMNWLGLWCPCCGYRLRCRPRNITYKDKFKNTDFKTGSIVRIYKDWKKCEGFQYRAILVELIPDTVRGVGAMWTVRKENGSLTEKRFINIENKEKVLVV